MSATVIELEDVYKSYGDFDVLRGANLRIASGEIYALLGANGAGKTTLIHTLMGFLRPTKGKVRILGRAPNLVQGQIGYIPERLRYHTRYSAREYLRFMGRFSDMEAKSLEKRIDFLLELVELKADADRRLSSFSKGMLQRLGVAQALLANPDVLLIDEPTSGLDLAGQREVVNILAELRGSGHTILLCTHYLSEVERLCDRVGVLAEGRITNEAAVANLRGLGASVLVRTFDLPEPLRRELAAIGPEVTCSENEILLRPNTVELQAHVLRRLLEQQVAIVALEPLESQLEHFYSSATTHGVVPRTAPSMPSAPVAPRTPPVSAAAAVTRPLPETDGLAEPAPPPAAEPRAVKDTLLRELLQRSGSSPREE